MRHFCAGAVVALAFLCGQAAAQQALPLTERDDRNDPCRRFKMRVLVPSGPAADPLAKVPAPDIDPRIVHDPCPEEVPQLATVQPVEFPRWDGGVLSPPPFSFPPTSESRRGQRPPGGPLQTTTPAFEFPRHRR